MYSDYNESVDKDSNDNVRYVTNDTPGASRHGRASS